MDALGGDDSPAGSCVWFVVELEMSVREWAARSGWSGNPCRSHLQAEFLSLRLQSWRVTSARSQVHARPELLRIGRTVALMLCYKSPHRGVSIEFAILPVRREGATGAASLGHFPLR
jgi:hypothetical protein